MKKMYHFKYHYDCLFYLGPVHIQNITKADLSPLDIAGLAPFTRYVFWLRAVNTAGVGPSSADVVCRTAQGSKKI